MTFINLIERRKSVRNYQRSKLSSNELKEIENFLTQFLNGENTLQKDIAIDFALVEDGWKKEDVLKGRTGYSGHPILAPHYIALLSEPKEGYLLNTSYVLEQLVLKAVEMDIGTCWISVEKDSSDLKRDLGIATSGEIVALIALGNSKTRIPYTKKSATSRIGVEDFVYKDKWGNTVTYEEIEKMGIGTALHSIRFAPSWANLQPWKLIIDNDKIILTVGGTKVDNKHLMLDAGIMMLYMEKAFSEAGINAKWNICKEESKRDFSEYNIPSEYTIIGTLHI